MRLGHQDIIGLELVEPRRSNDERGFFWELYNSNVIDEQNIKFLSPVQDNLSLSKNVGTIRGLHLQSPPHAQSKFVSVLSGAIFDVAVDVRRGSATFGCYAAVELTSDNGHQFFIPQGFAHGFMTLSKDTMVHYKVDTHYAPGTEKGIHFADPSLCIDWPLDAGLTVSKKDDRLPSFDDFVRNTDPEN